jgi:prolycopene isomerase
MAKYDVIVIGGGMGGMVAANYLASLGRRVLVLEQNHHTGGNMSGFRRGGYYFDGGDQSFESLGIVFPILEELGLRDKIEWSKARFRMVSKDFDFFIDSFDGIEDALMNAFPEEKGISSLFREVREVSAFLDAYSSPWSFPLLHDFSFSRVLGAAAKWAPKLFRWLTYDYRVKACSVIKDPALRAWFTDIGYYHMPYIFFAGFWHIWMKDYWYPKGGMQAFHDVLAERFTSLGGEIRFNTRVQKIEHRGRRAAFAVTEKGEFFDADKFVYAGDYKRLVGSILDPSLFRSSFLSKIRQVKLTEEILNVYLGVDMDPGMLASRLEAQHLFYFTDYNAIFPNRESPRDVHKNMWIALNHFGLENPACAPPGKTTLVLQTYSSYDWENYWQNGSGAYPRSPAYREFKNEIGGHLVRFAENVIPELGPRIEHFEVGTPLSIERFSLNTRGSTGGWCYEDTESPVYRFPGLNLFKTPLENLRACGHYSLWPGGVISAALSGKIVGNLTAGRKALARLEGPGK